MLGPFVSVQSFRLNVRSNPISFVPCELIGKQGLVTLVYYCSQGTGAFSFRYLACTFQPAATTSSSLPPMACQVCVRIRLQHLCAARHDPCIWLRCSEMRASAMLSCKRREHVSGDESLSSSLEKKTRRGLFELEALRALWRRAREGRSLAR